MDSAVSDAAREPASAVDTLGRFWRPGIIVFVSNTCVMVLELVAGRIIAPYVGVSLYTWTSVIGVVLAGISLGNYLGGWLADRWASLKLLGVVFLLGGLSSFGILAFEVTGNHLPNWGVVAQILILTAALFFVPSMVLGGISPIVAKLAVRDLSRTGSTLGRIYAAGTLGSIVGTFATGFVLIAWFGTHAIVWGVAVILLVMGALLMIAGGRSGRGRVISLIVALVLIAGAAGVAVAEGALRSVCTRETNYFCIKVHESERNGGPVLVLILDRLVHSYTSLDHPDRLVYEYERIYAEATAYQAGRHKDLSALFIGGGGYTFPRYMAYRYPGSQLDVVEIDPGVTEVAHDLLGLPRDGTIASYNEDARLFLTHRTPTPYTLIMGDAFNDYSVPYHLTTKEFNDRVRAWLTTDGLYMVNLIDGPRRDFLRAYVGTLRQTFRYVYVVPGVQYWRESPRVTFVLIATDASLDLAAFKSIDAGDGETLLANRVLSDAETDAILAEGRRVALTDQYAPVDQMLAPVFRDEAAPTPAPAAAPTAAPVQ
jgi:spermidine synthase